MKHRVDKDDEDDDRNDPDPIDQGSDKYSKNSDGYLPHYHPSVAKESVRPSENTLLSVPRIQNNSTSNANISQSQTERENNIDEERIIQAFFLTNKKCKKQLGDFKATLSNCSVSESVNNREVHTNAKTTCVLNNTTVTVSSQQEDVAQGKIPEDDQEKPLLENSRDVSQAMPPQRGANKHERKPEDSFAYYGNFCVGQPKNLPSSSTALNMSVLKTLQANKSLVADRLHFKKIACSKAVQYALFQCGTVTRSLNECQALIKLNDARSCYFEKQSEKPQPLPVLVVDYFPTSLENLINRLAITLDAIRYAVLSDVALGLNYLHNGSTCIVHRDLSAKNVLISTCSLQAKIVDFDIDVDSTAQTQCSESLTTDCTSTVDTSSDIFSFGVLMIQMFIEQPHLNGQTAASVWLQYRQYLESIGYFDPLLSQLIHSCITHNPQSKVKAIDIAHQLTHLAQWFPVSSTHKKQWLSLLQAPVEPPPGNLSLTFPSQYDDEECSSFETSDHSTTPQVDNIIPAPSLPIDTKVCICTSESRILEAVKQNKADLIMLSLSNSTNSITVQRYMHTLAFLCALPPRHVPLVPYAFLKQIRIVSNHIAKLVKVASQLFRALDNVHTLSNNVEVSGFLDLPTDFPHCGQNKSLVYIVSGDNIDECLMLKITAFISTSATQSQIHNRTLDKPTCDELLLCQHSAIPFQQPTLITFDIETAKKTLQNGLLIIAKKMIFELHLKLKWSKRVLTQVQTNCLLPITIGACVSPAKPHKRDDSSLSMCSCLTDTVHVREESTKKENSKIVLKAFQSANMTQIHIYCLLCFHSRQNQIMCTYLYQNLKNIKSRMIQAITPLPHSVDIAQQLSSRTEVSGSLRLCNNLYHSSQLHQSLTLTVNENDLDKSLALDRAADISTLHNKCSQLFNKRLDQPNFNRLLLGQFADHKFVPNPVAGNMTMKITPARSSKSTMSVAKQAHPLSSSQPVNVLPFLPTVTTHNSCASYECSPHDTPHAIEKPSRSLLKLAAKKGLKSSLTRFKTPKMKPHRKKKYKTMCLRAYKYPTKRTLQIKEMPTLSDNLCKLSGRSKSPLHFFKSKIKSYTMTNVNILYQYFFQWLHMYMYLNIQNCEDNNTLPSRDSLINSIVVTRKRELTHKLHVTPPTSLPVDCEVGFKDEVITLTCTTCISFESGAFSVFSVILNLIHVCLYYISSVSSNLYYDFELSEQARGISEGQLIEKCCRYQTLVHLQRSQHMYATTEVQLHGSQTTITNECGLLSSRHGSEIHSYTLNHEEKSKLVSVQDNKGNCGCTESSMDKNKNEKGDTDCDKSDESGRGDLEDRRGNDGENRDCNSDNEGEGYLGEEEDSDNNEERDRERTRRKCRGRKKMKKRRRSSTKKNLRLFRYVDHPIALVRGLDDDRPEKETNPPTSQAQQETNHHPPLAMQIVDGVAVHTRICPPLQPRVNQQPVGAHFIPQVQQQPYHHSPVLQTQQEQKVNPNSSFAATPSVPTKETCHQCTSATAHGSVLVQPQVVRPPRVTIETQTEGTLIIVPQPLANVSPSSAIDSGLGTTNLTSSGHQSHPLPQNNHFQHVSTPARQRRSENSSINEPRWNYATAHVGAPIMNDNHDTIQSHDFSHYVQVGTTDDEMQNGPHANEPLQAHNEQVNQGQEDTEWNYANTIARGYESAEAEEGECLPTHSAIIAIPHGGQRRPRLQFAAISPQQNSSSSGAAHGANLSPLNLVTASLPPVVSSFGTLMEASIEPLIHLPNEVRPMPVVHGVSQAYQPHPRPGNPPVPTLPHTQGVMMFGALEQPADDEQLVGVPGPVVNNVLPRQNAVNAHIPSMIHSSTPQAGNSLSFHALVEDSQPRELFTVL